MYSKAAALNEFEILKDVTLEGLGDNADGANASREGQMRQIEELQGMPLRHETVRQRGADVADSQARAGHAIGPILLDSYATI